MHQDVLQVVLQLGNQGLAQEHGECTGRPRQQARSHQEMGKHEKGGGQGRYFLVHIPDEEAQSVPPVILVSIVKFSDE